MKTYKFFKYAINKNIDDIGESVNAVISNTAKEFTSKVISTSAITVDNEPFLIVTIEFEKK